MNSKISSLVAGFLTSRSRRKSLHVAADVQRRIMGKPRELHYFHQVSDPYSHLMVQMLPHLAERFGLTIRPYVISGINPDMTPEPDMLKEYSLRDAVDLAELYDFSFPSGARYRTMDISVLMGAHLARVATRQPAESCTEAL